jgi:hypothetical protein
MTILVREPLEIIVMKLFTELQLQFQFFPVIATYGGFMPEITQETGAMQLLAILRALVVPVPIG